MSNFCCLPMLCQFSKYKKIALLVHSVFLKTMQILIPQARNSTTKLILFLIGENFEKKTNNKQSEWITFFLAWYDSPIVTVLETLTYPIEELPFPTVTVCPKDSNPDRWGPTIKLFDHLNRRCGSDR